jgi:hypothetical protein
MAVARRARLPFPSRLYLSTAKAPATPLSTSRAPTPLSLAHALPLLGFLAAAPLPAAQALPPLVKCPCPLLPFFFFASSLIRPSIRVTGSSSPSIKCRRRHLQLPAVGIDLPHHNIPAAHFFANPSPCGERLVPHLFPLVSRAAVLPAARRSFTVRPHGRGVLAVAHIISPNPWLASPSSQLHLGSNHARFCGREPFFVPRWRPRRRAPPAPARPPPPGRLHTLPIVGSGADGPDSPGP